MKSLMIPLTVLLLNPLLQQVLTLSTKEINQAFSVMCYSFGITPGFLFSHLDCFLMAFSPSQINMGSSIVWVSLGNITPLQ